MKAVGLFEKLPISDADCLLDLDLPKPVPTGRDLLVAIEAIAVNPVDYKMRSPDGKPASDSPKVLGWDASGFVVAVGPDVTLFQPGDAVYYAGDITRPGANSEFHLIDERIVGRKPTSLSFEEAAALPLTAITAWEALFDRMGLAKDGSDAGKRLLIIGGAGGVGSIAIQLAKQVAGVTVIATASRPESADWCRQMGADLVIDHFGDMRAQLANLQVPHVEYILCASDTDPHFTAMANLIAPQGKICAIVNAEEPHDLSLIYYKSAAFMWEFMFTRAMFQTPDMQAQHELLNAVAALVDSGRLRTTLGEVLGPINAANLKQAHARLEGGRAIGKLVLSRF